jgi:predicted transcriptional regulator
MEIITIRLDPELHEQLKAYCKENDRSVSNTMRYALKQFLQNIQSHNETVSNKEEQQ